MSIDLELVHIAKRLESRGETELVAMVQEITAKGMAHNLAGSNETLSKAPWTFGSGGDGAWLNNHPNKSGGHTFYGASSGKTHPAYKGVGHHFDEGKPSHVSSADHYLKTVVPHMVKWVKKNQSPQHAKTSLANLAKFVAHVKKHS